MKSIERNIELNGVFAWLDSFESAASHPSSKQYCVDIRHQHPANQTIMQRSGWHCLHPYMIPARPPFSFLLNSLGAGI